MCTQCSVCTFFDFFWKNKHFYNFWSEKFGRYFKIVYICRRFTKRVQSKHSLYGIE